MTFEELKEYGQLFYRENYKLDRNLETKVFKINNIKSYQREPNDTGGTTDWTDNLILLYNLLHKLLGSKFSFQLNFKKRTMSIYFAIKKPVTVADLQKQLPLVDVVDIETDEVSSIATIDISKFTTNYGHATQLFERDPYADLNLSDLTNLKDAPAGATDKSEKTTTDDDSPNNDLSLNVETLDTNVDALAELKGLTGLEEAKQQITDMVAIAKMNQLRKDHGLKTPEGISNHMIFTGNPGTGKTTVAKLFATILYQNDIITANKLVLTDRSDLVGHYTGTTADRTKKVIQAALGGVLFIDEAYQLSHPDSPTDFGHEAIDQLIIGMENHREDLIVILAGYTDQMETFLNDNPGLRSRIPNRVHFEDYTTGELTQIILNMINKEQIVTLEHDSYFTEVVTNFINQNNPSGNARWARNIYQAMLQAQARRVAFQPHPTKKDLQTITNSDVDAALMTTPTN
ncbi:AAA family ATPase [Fructilactobacillus cliffordii]|uniref:AAA family ATPase n=1 Tax=Fructilactobacillus cliffordii TaxID=2940299 RepID=UPI0020923DAC|nr:AAA family ATPase [Fructilactobacillus cliffordii]USS85831.1 AAA family ATPase [Fructilactobacillus cliffordii]